MKWIFWCFLVPLYRPAGLSLLLLLTQTILPSSVIIECVTLESFKSVLKIGEHLDVLQF